jgi:hypothetical protein
LNLQSRFFSHNSPVFYQPEGLVNKFLLLHDFLSSVHVDIVSISETWLDSSVKDSEFVPNGYKIFRQDRDLNFYTRGTYTQTSRGGTLLLVKKNSTWFLITVLADSSLESPVSVSFSQFARFLSASC